MDRTWLRRLPLAAVLAPALLLAACNDDKGTAGLEPGIWVAFARDDEDREGLATTVTVLRHGDEPRDLTEPGQYGYALLRWAPDGSKIAAVRSWTRGGAGEERELSLVLIDPVAGDQDVAGDLTDSILGLADIAWSPDGETVAAVAAEHIRFWRADGSELTTVGLGPGEGSLFGGVFAGQLWSPDSAYIMGIRANDPLVVSRDGEVIRLAATPGAPDFRPSPGPAGPPIPVGWVDERTVAFAVGRTETEYLAHIAGDGTITWTERQGAGTLYVQLRDRFDAWRMQVGSADDLRIVGGVEPTADGRGHRMVFTSPWPPPPGDPWVDVGVLVQDEGGVFTSLHVERAHASRAGFGRYPGDVIIVR